MWRSIIPCWPRTKVCVGHLEDIQRRNPSLLYLSINSQLCRGSARCTGALCSSSVWPCEQWRESEWGTEAAVVTERQTNGWPSTNSSCKLHLWNTQRELPTRQVMSGHRCLRLFPSYLVLANGGGCKRSKEAGKWSGQHSQKLLMPVLNCSYVAARRAAGHSANMWKLLYSVLVSVCVEAYVTVNDLDDVGQYFLWKLVSKMWTNCYIVQ